MPDLAFSTREDLQNRLRGRLFSCRGMRPTNNIRNSNHKCQASSQRKSLTTCWKNSSRHLDGELRVSLSRGRLTRWTRSGFGDGELLCSSLAHRLPHRNCNCRNQDESHDLYRGKHVEQRSPRTPCQMRTVPNCFKRPFLIERSGGSCGNPAQPNNDPGNYRDSQPSNGAEWS